MKKNSTLIARAIPSLRRAIAPYRMSRESLVLVPTMGALHRGHMRLIEEAHKVAQRVIVSIFVNPTQFNANEDFARYPRPLEQDIKMLVGAKVDVIWTPSNETMYPAGFATRVLPEGVARVGLEDKFRPHFFGGVTTVVAKLFAQTMPDMAIFGQKDYQQLRVIMQMVKDIDLPIKIIGVPTVREKDGLALSSRNVYLSATERAIAPALYNALRTSAERIKKNESIEGVLAAGRAEITKAGFTLDYLEARHALTLAPIFSRKDGPIRLLVAAKLGKTRLIDNIGV